MPIYLRRFYTKKLEQAKKAEKEAQEKANKGQSNTIHKPPSFQKAP